MKILYYHRTLADGAEGIHIREIVGCFRKLGHEVKIVSVLGQKNHAAKEDGTWKSSTVKEWLIAKLRCLLPDFFYELAEILTNLPATRLIERSIREFEPDMVYERYSNYGFAASRIARKRGIPIVLEANVAYYPYKMEWEKSYFPRVLKRVEKQTFETVDHIIVVSTTLKKIVQEYGIPETKITVMPNGVNLDHFRPSDNGHHSRDELGIQAQIVLGFVGTIRRWHRMDQLFQVLHELDLPHFDAKMLVIGDCPFMEELEQEVAALGEKDRILFAGRLPHNEMPKYLDVIDIAISPFAVSYSSPMKILEYMAMGKCVIAPDMENIRDIIKPNQTGLLFKPGDAGELKQKLLACLQDPTLRHQLARAGCDDIRQNYTWQKNAEWVLDIYQNLRHSDSTGTP